MDSRVMGVCHCALYEPISGCFGLLGVCQVSWLILALGVMTYYADYACLDNGTRSLRLVGELDFDRQAYF